MAVIETMVIQTIWTGIRILIRVLITNAMIIIMIIIVVGIMDTNHLHDSKITIIAIKEAIENLIIITKNVIIIINHVVGKIVNLNIEKIDNIKDPTTKIITINVIIIILIGINPKQHLQIEIPIKNLMLFL